MRGAIEGSANTWRSSLAFACSSLLTVKFAESSRFIYRCSLHEKESTRGGFTVERADSHRLRKTCLCPIEASLAKLRARGRFFRLRQLIDNSRRVATLSMEIFQSALYTLINSSLVEDESPNRRTRVRRIVSASHRRLERGNRWQVTTW